MQELEKCKICPHNCGVNRLNGNIGRCKSNGNIKLAMASIHNFEEPCISGENGSGTVFFSNCNMNCVFCQNYKISQQGLGREISIEELAEIFIDEQNKNAENINLVTPTHYIPLIKEGLILAKKQGLTIPIVYNTSGYEKVSSLKSLEGLIDIYLPDFKYYDNNLGKYSNVSNYYDIATKAIEEMYRQVGKPKYNNELLIKGLIVRHLVLPGHIEDSKKIIKYLYTKYHDNIILSIMNQYTPIKELKYKELNRRVTVQEYNELIDYAYDLGVRNCFTQEEESQSDSFIPNFKGDSII